MTTFKQFLNSLSEADENTDIAPDVDAPAPEPTDTESDTTNPEDVHSIPETTVEDLWEEVKADAKSYIPDTEYFVKVNPDKAGDYDITYTEGGRRVLYATVPYTELKAAYSPVYPNQTPDVEGYTKWRSLDRIDAVQYKGDPRDVLIGEVKARVNDGDFVTRTTSGEFFVYAIESERFFKQAFRKL